MDYEQLYPGFEQAFDVGFDQDGVFHMLTNSPDGRVQIEITMHPRLAEKLGSFLTTKDTKGAENREQVTGKQVKSGYRPQVTGDRDRKPNLQTTKGYKGN